MKSVYLDDSKMNYDDAKKYFRDANVWALEFCQSYIGHHVQDVSDVSYTCDNIAAYQFKDPKDAVLFELKWR